MSDESIHNRDIESKFSSGTLHQFVYYLKKKNINLLKRSKTKYKVWLLISRTDVTVGERKAGRWR